MDIQQMRLQYEQHGLHRSDLDPDPFQQFQHWFEQACAAKLLEPNAMALATVGASGMPALRTVLLKYFDQDGFVFYTNYESQKAREIAGNSQVALLFFWAELARQVQIVGKAEKVATAQTLAYFATRPRGSQLGAWASAQSQVISSRSLLQAKWEEMKRKFAGGEVGMPAFWGGYRVIPEKFEFWQGQTNRLHDRFVYLPNRNGEWQINRLAP
jgi:pyridoxamine 5'-phosphate oxidase